MVPQAKATILSSVVSAELGFDSALKIIALLLKQDRKKIHHNPSYIFISFLY